MTQTAQKTSDFTHDAIIVGGGMVGFGLGLAFAHGGLSSIVVDLVDPATQDNAQFDGRASAIAPGIKAMFERLGVWDHLEAGQVQPMTDILVTDGRISDGAAPLYLHFEPGDTADGGPLSYMMENRHLRRALATAVDLEPRITLKAPARVTDIDRREDAVVATLDDGTVIRAPLIIAADGARSQTRDALGFKTVGWSYDQKGIVTTVTHQQPHEGVAQEYFLPGGPFAILPIPDDAQGNHRASLVWTERTQMAETLMALDDQGFAEELRKRFGDYLGAVAPVGPRFSYPLHMRQATDFAGPRAALVGDAAHVVHPLAGQGVNLGLKDVAALAEVVADAKRVGLDWGSPSVLVRYERWRRFDTVAMALVTDGMNRLFSNDLPPVRILRDLGLAAVDRLPPVKKFLMRNASGKAGSAPKLLQGRAL